MKKSRAEDDILLAFARVGMANAPPTPKQQQHDDTPPLLPSPLPEFLEKGFSVPKRAESGSSKVLVLTSPPTSGYDSDVSSSSGSIVESPDKFQSRQRSLSTKRESQYGQKTPSLNMCYLDDSGSLSGSSSSSSCGSYFHDEVRTVESKSKSPSRRKKLSKKGRSSDSSYYELSKSGTLHVPGFMLKASGLSPAAGAGEAFHNGLCSKRLGKRRSSTGNVSNITVETIEKSRQRRTGSSGNSSGNTRLTGSSNQLLTLAATNRTLEEVDEIGGYSSDDELSSGGSGGDSGSLYSKLFNDEELVFLKRLGKGASGVVHLALHVTALRLVAVKVVPVFDDQKRAQMVAELKALYANQLKEGEVNMGKQLAHCPYIVGMYDAYVKKDDSTINLGLEWMDGGSIQGLVDTKGILTEPEIAVILHCVLRGLAQLHGSRQLHRDIKPSNMLLSTTNGLVKLSDFGISYTFGSFSAANTFVGSLSYMAPERISGDDEGYSYPADVWSVGLSIFVCATGRYPFQREYDEQGYWGLVHAIDEQPSPQLFMKDGFSRELCEFLDRCLCKDPEQRATVSQLLSHPFLTKRYPYDNVVGIEFCNDKSVQKSKEKWQELDRLVDEIAHYHLFKCSKLQHTQPRFASSKLHNLAVQLGLVGEDEKQSPRFKAELQKRLDRLNNLFANNSISGGGFPMKKKSGIGAGFLNQTNIIKF